MRLCAGGHRSSLPPTWMSVGVSGPLMSGSIVVVAIVVVFGLERMTRRASAQRDGSNDNAQTDGLEDREADIGKRLPEARGRPLVPEHGRPHQNSPGNLPKTPHAAPPHPPPPP